MTSTQLFQTFGLNQFDRETSLQILDFLQTNEPFINRLLTDPTPRLGWCVDGTCCCGKTGVTNTKITNFFEAPMRNRSPSASLGFVYTGLDIMARNNRAFHSVWDRKPTNNLDWTRIWSLIDGGPVDAVMQTLPREVEEFYLEQFYTIQVIDSNEQAVKQRMKKRNETSDFMRSQMDDYVSAQNTFYEMQHKQFPELVAIFDHQKYSNSFSLLKNIVKLLKQFGRFEANEYLEPYVKLVVDPRSVDLTPLNNYATLAKQFLFTGNMEP